MLAILVKRVFAFFASDFWSCILAKITICRLVYKSMKFKTFGMSGIDVGGYELWVRG